MDHQEELQEAIFEFQQYLSDHKPPLMVADSVEALLHFPPDFVAAQVAAWLAAQQLTAPVADYLYHAAKKIWAIAELDLLPKDFVANFIRRLGPALLPHCPDVDREMLAENLERLGQAVARPVATPVVLHRQAGEDLNKQPEHSLSREVRRLSLLLEHLRPMAGGAFSVTGSDRTALTSQFMATAAVQSTSGKELDQRLAPLQELGIDVTSAQVFRTLAGSLAGWLLPKVEGVEAPAISSQQIAAMGQIVSLAADPAQAAQRFREMVHAAVEQFNEGHLGRAASMFSLAERLAAEQKVKAPFVDAVRTGHDYLDPERLRRFTDRPENRPSLRAVLEFFVALRPAGLLLGLEDEPRRERRHLMLALLEVHEQAGRAAAWERLQGAVAEGADQLDAFFLRNLVYLMRIIPRPEGASVEEEVDAVIRIAGRSTPPPLVKQVIAFLAYSRHDKAERALIGYLKVFENMMMQPDTAAYDAQEVEGLLDRTCAGLARYGTPRAWRVLIDHGLKAEARLGSPFLRLAEAGRVDLSSSPDLVQRIIEAVRAELPRGGMLGLMSKRKEEKAIALLQALAGTPVREVQELYKEVASRYQDRALGELAAKSLANLATVGKPAPAPATLSGDLELFGLPNVLHTIHQSGLSGVLTVVNQAGTPQSTLLFDQGEFLGGQCGNVLGEEAVYQLVERPFPGTFAFVSRNDVKMMPRAGQPKDVLGVLLEGVRRYDDFQRAAAVAPDTAAYTAGATARTTPEDEDPDFSTYVWGQASTGKTVQECEASIGTDSFRVRRLIAHWVEEGALRAV